MREAHGTSKSNRKHFGSDRIGGASAVFCKYWDSANLGIASMAKRILIYGMNYSPELAGAGRYTGEIAEFLASLGSDVVVVTTPPHYPGWRVQNSYSNRGFTTEIRNQVRVIRCPLFLHKRMAGFWRLLASLSFAVTSAPVLLWQLLRFRPDIALSVVPTMSGAPFVLAGARLVGAKTILHMHDLEADAAFAVGHLNSWGWLKILAYAFERMIVGHFDKVITISDRMADKIVDKGVRREDIAVIRNWVDLDLIKPLLGQSPYREEMGYPGDQVVVLYSGNIGRKQGLDVLCEAAKRLVRQSKIQFVIAGEGPAKADLVDRFGQLSNVRFLPFQPYERLGDFLGMADVHVLPQEANVADLVLPSKLGGMLASGKPIIVMTETDTELADFLRDSVVQVQPGDIDALAVAIFAFSKSGLSDDGKARFRRVLASQLSKREGLVRFAHATIGA
jgi:colanic acid biosynthesis glycosyl transferase WcaI